MKQYWLLYCHLHIMIIGAVLFLAGCNLLAGDASQPPLPIIVPRVTPEAAVTAAISTTTAPAPTQSAGDTLNLPQPTPENSTQTNTTTQPTETPVPPPPLDLLNITLEPFVTGFTKPVYLTHANDGSSRVFVVEQAGRILVVKDGKVNPTPFLDITTLVGSDSSEQGLLSVAFHPNYVTTGWFFVNYTDKQGDTVIARYQVSNNPDIAASNSGLTITTIGQPYVNHNGGQILFGPDGYLYVGMGDGGAANDPQNRAQELNILLGKIWRIDIDQVEPYGVPETNPFVGAAQARPEIWSYGWRNPWRISFDAGTDDMYVGDVGQNQYEEIHIEPAGSGGGQNYGWRLMEGSHCFNPDNCDPAALGVVLPIAEYDHSQGCSVTGGYVYRGQQFPALQGIYFYGDYCSGNLWGLRHEPNGDWVNMRLLSSGKSISSFGQDQSGELYLIDHKGDIYQITNNQ